MIYFLLLFIVFFFVLFFLFTSYNLKIKMKDFFSTYFIILIVIFFVIAIIIFPDDSVTAAYEGLITWFTIVLPALLPFFIGSELLIGLGVVKFIGTLLEPIMRPIFNVPGEGSFAFAMSITSGYPVGTKIVSKLRSDKVISRIEAQRLISFCSTSGPLFLIGAVAVGMFHSAKVGILIASCHYLSAILVGMVFRFYKKSSLDKKMFQTKKELLIRAFSELKKSRKQGYSFGLLLGNAVKDSINTMLIVGGFIVLFSVIIHILENLGIFTLISSSLQFVLRPLHMDQNIIKALLTGMFEITMGSKMTAEIFHAEMLTKIAVTSFIIAWSGLSIHAQAISIISTTDIQPSLYILSKFLHGIFSFILVYIFYPIFTAFFEFSKPVSFFYDQLSIYKKILFHLRISTELFILVLISLLIISLLTAILLSIKEMIKKG